MSGWHTGPLALFDLETTGVDPHRDRIVTAAIIEVGAGRDTATHTWLLNPGIDIPNGAAAVHGITTAHAREHGTDNATGIREITSTILDRVKAGAPVVGHNVTYDLTMLWAEAIRHGHTHHVAALEDLAQHGCVVDTFVLDKAVDPYRKGPRKLVDVARHYGVTLTEAEAHGAEADALAAGRIAWCIAQRHPLVQRALADLHAWQRIEKHHQAESFGKYLRRQGKTDDVARDWPLQSPPPDWHPDQHPTPREDAA